ncbi:hypothetical protein CF326_g5353 [Tilletia indica]|nr:hypothetical protein CF326_g5353 [Tilletia indica]
MFGFRLSSHPNVVIVDGPNDWPTTTRQTQPPQEYPHLPSLTMSYFPNPRSPPTPPPKSYPSIDFPLFSQLPSDIVCIILSWCDYITLKKLSRTSRTMRTILNKPQFARALFRRPTAPIPAIASGTGAQARSTLPRRGLPRAHPMLAKMEWFMREWFCGVPPPRRIGQPAQSVGGSGGELTFPPRSTNRGLRIPDESAFMPPTAYMVISLGSSGWDTPTVTRHIHTPHSQQAITVEEVLEAWAHLGRKWSRLYGFFWYDDSNDEVAYTGLLRKEPRYYDVDFSRKNNLLTMSVDLH